MNPKDIPIGRLQSISIILYIAVVLISQSRNGLAEVIAYSFSTDPGWHLNSFTLASMAMLDRDDSTIRLHPQDFPHDFGFRHSNHAGGEESGEIGGIIGGVDPLKPERSFEYGVGTVPLSFSQPLTAAGRIRFIRVERKSGVLFGWYNRYTAVGNPPDHFLGLMIVGGESDECHGCLTVVSATGRKKTSSELITIDSDDLSAAWWIRFKPAMDSGTPIIEAGIAAQSILLKLNPTDIQDGAAFNQFGILSCSGTEASMEVYFDDLAMEGPIVHPVESDPDLRQPRPIDAVDSVFMEELTWMEIRDAIQGGKNRVIVATGGIEQSGPFVVTGKHNYILRLMTESVARELGDTLVAPIVKYVPEGRIQPSTHHMRYPGTIGVKEETFVRMLSDICASLKQNGFQDIILIGDSGDNQTGMKNVGAYLNHLWGEDSTQVHYIADYYRIDNRGRKLMRNLSLNRRPDLAEFPNVHSSFRYEAILTCLFPELIRSSQRMDKNLFHIDQIELSPLKQTVAAGKRFIEYRTEITMQAIRKALRDSEK
ncbi:MAG TPA: hypothetical protein EYQ50_20370 [Verrucomicrobiales bacterium]|nr:hypothetical protein [Verrucomicrobiales bacterium]HIL71989.1 hypothetical protein [Verrucomicrobiota bacterium]